MLTDEAQMCKTGGPEMAVQLTKINRWAVTGTPLSDSFDDLVSQLYFLELERGSDLARRLRRLLRRSRWRRRRWRRRRSVHLARGTSGDRN